MRRTLLLYIFLILFQLITADTFANNKEGVDPISTSTYANLDLKDLKLRVKNLNIPFKPKFSREVREKIEDYVKIYRKKTSRILGLSSIYFPVIEEYLKANNIPDALKYLPIIETDLNPKAVSPDGAVGIWQFMPSTGAIYGLSSDQVVDQRCDIHRSTDAAAKYLLKLFDIYEDWALVLAAYNAGPGRVNQAIKKAHSTNYWTIERYLPLQTRKYIPSFLAAAYAMQYFPEYDIIADNPDLDLQLTKETKIFRELSFEEISTATGLSLETLRILNPQYLQDFIPVSADGNFLTLPKRIIASFNDYINLPEGRKNDFLKIAHMIVESATANTTFYHNSLYTVGPTESLKSIADIYNISTHSLIVWNNITDLTLKPGTELTLYLPKKVETKLVEMPTLKRMKTKKLSRLSIHEIEKLPIALDMSNQRKYSSANYISYMIGPDESLKSVAEKYGVSLESLICLNKFTKDYPPLPGMLVRIKESELIKP
ncbi:MAG TPA: transglycosylase SLT domain-containing protein [Saprospiraceae bacterium]|nr:transglycosylase SLT domain-containing protein [Saprospiraceae bacterium]